MSQGLLRTFLLIFLIIEIYSVLPRREPSEKTSPSNRSGIFQVRLDPQHRKESLEAVLTVAREAGLDFLVVTEPDSLPSEVRALEGHYDGVDVYTEMEVHTPAGHAIWFTSAVRGQSSDAELKKAAWTHYLGSARMPGAFLSLSHPSSHTQPWIRLDRPGDGAELLSLGSNVRDAYENPFSAFLTALLLPANNYLAFLRLLQYPEEAVRSWDANNALTPGRFAIFSHELPFISAAKLGSPWNTYRPSIRLARNVVFCSKDGDFSARRQTLYRAIERGESALVVSGLAPFGESSWSMHCGEHRYTSSSIPRPLEPHCFFETKAHPNLPTKARLFRNGEFLSESTLSNEPWIVPVEASGTYRLEAVMKIQTRFGIFLDQEVPWLFYNPIYVH